MTNNNDHDPYADPYAAIISLFNKNHIEYIVVGVSGINYYASSPAETFATQDFDIFLNPKLENVRKALTLLSEKGYTLNTRYGQISLSSLSDILRDQRTMIASDPYGVTIKLLLSISGFAFSEMARDPVIFLVSGVPCKVGKLSKLLLSKKAAGRKKDKFFLKRYEILLEERKNNSSEQ